MPNLIDEHGIKTKTLDEIISSIVDGDTNAPGLKTIYGDDINIDSDTPDGQLVNIFALAVKDVLDLATQIYNSFDPDFAVGRLLDQRCAINGIERQGATYTETSIDVEVDRALTLPGLDDPASTPFTVSDAEGNKFLLKTTAIFEAPGTRSLAFRAEESGSVRVLPYTINTQVTITLGVVKVDNPPPTPPAIPTTIGVDEESDFDLRIRRARALSLPATGSVDGILSSILDVPGVTEAIVYENTTNQYQPDDPDNPDAIPGHSIWCIVAGGDDKEVARAIYLKRNAGCGMKGDVSAFVPQEDGSKFEILFDRPAPQPLWISFTAKDLAGVAIANTQDLRAALLAALRYSVNQSADITTIAKAAREAFPDAVIIDAGVSTTGGAGEWQPILAPSSKRNRFVLANERIIINGEPGESEEPENPEELGAADAATKGKKSGSSLF
jgi:uncharacterized phage protein gp47/JayE